MYVNVTRRHWCKYRSIYCYIHLYAAFRNWRIYIYTIFKTHMHIYIGFGFKTICSKVAFLDFMKFTGIFPVNHWMILYLQNTRIRVLAFTYFHTDIYLYIHIHAHTHKYKYHVHIRTYQQSIYLCLSLSI